MKVLNLIPNINIEMLRRIFYLEHPMRPEHTGHEKRFKQWLTINELLIKDTTPIKTGTIILNNIKSTDGWHELGTILGFDSRQIAQIFKYGEFGDITIEVDENLNIIGGKIHRNE